MGSRTLTTHLLFIECVFEVLVLPVNIQFSTADSPYEGVDTLSLQKSQSRMPETGFF